jgi:EAL domain-containing protein (putative c-di-GMP-specific phosphodiesterase class I)/PAS domain-containing protein
MGEQSWALNTDSLLGVVFAGADVVFEVDREGLIRFALGAVEGLTGASADSLKMQPWNTIFGPDDQDLLGALLAGLGTGERLGPLRVTLSKPDGSGRPRAASLSVFKLPRKASDLLSCALSLGGHNAPSALGPPGGLVPKENFANLASRLVDEARSEGLAVRLDLVELEGLSASTQGMAGEALRRKIAATLRADSFGGLGGAEVAPDRFAVLRDASASLPRLSTRLKAIVGNAVQPVTVALPFESESTAQNLRAMRLALDRYIENGAKAAENGFAAMVKLTMGDSSRFKTMLSDDAFRLVYQPVVSLSTRELHHYEALTRFEGDVSPADTIRMAEELNLIVDFDVAVVRKVVKALTVSEASTRIAANFSGLSLVAPGFLEQILELTSAQPQLRPRLLIEVTETEGLPDLDQANRIIQVLRDHKHLVCVDDFGSGSASLDYLRRMDVDFIKIDGRYVQSLHANSREETMIKYMVAMCREMGIGTIAEMMETEESVSVASALGVDLGQGWRFGKPTAEPAYKQLPAASAPRRKGATDDWG